MISNPIAGTICFSIVLCCICICMRYQSSKDSEESRKGYAFSLLKDGGSFFDDDEKEIIIFRRPVDGTYFIACTKIQNNRKSQCVHTKMLIFICHNVGNSPNDNEITRPYFDDDNSSEDGSDLEFIRPEQEWSDKEPR